MNRPARPTPEALYQEAPCGLVLAASDGLLLHVNDTFCRWLQMAREELVERVRLQDLLTMGGRIFYQTHLLPLLRMQASVAEVKLELRRHDGHAIPVLLNIAERPHEGGGTLLHAAVFVAEDRHKYERELLLQRRRAEELAAQHARDEQELAAARAQAEDRALFAEQLVGMVSHDIRNPLSVIHMSAVLLERGADARQQQAAVERVGRAVQRVQHLIGDLLDFTQAKLGSGLAVRQEDTDLRQLVVDAVGELSVAFPRLELRHAHAGDSRCRADPHRIEQAIGNLVANAATHGDPARPVTVRSEVAGDLCRVTVHNHGQPIPPALVSRLFEPMVRGAGAGASEGVGLGLFIVRAIARAHGGDVQARSTAEEGTTFSIEWPRAPAT